MTKGPLEVPVTASMVWLVDSDDPIADVRLGVVNDTDAADEVARSLAAENSVTGRGDGTLDSAMVTQPGLIGVGVYGRITVVAGDLGDVATPSRVPDALLHARPATWTMLAHSDAERSVGAFARWENGTLRRSFSADPVDITEDVGLPFLFEKAFWAGEHPLVYADGVPHDPLALPFHPIEFADAAATTWIGFRLTPPWVADGVTPQRLPVRRYVIHPQGVPPTDTPDRPVGEHGPDEGPTSSKMARWFGFGRG